MEPAGSAPLGHPTAPGSSPKTLPAAPSTRSTPQTAATRRQSIRAGSSSSPPGSRAAPAPRTRTRGRPSASASRPTPPNDQLQGNALPVGGAFPFFADSPNLFE